MHQTGKEGTEREIGLMPQISK